MANYISHNLQCFTASQLAVTASQLAVYSTFSPLANTGPNI